MCPGQTVVDHCAGIFATAEVCLFLPRHCRFVGCKIDTACFKKTFFGVVEVFVRQVLYEESNIVGEADVLAAEKVLVSAPEVNDVRRKRPLRDTPCGLCTTQAFTANVTHFLCHRFRAPSLYEMGKALSLSK